MNSFDIFAMRAVKTALLVGSFTAAVLSHAVTIPNSPLNVQPSAKPMIMLALGKDHRLYYEAYNDASDIDGDGAIDIRFKPSITYLGLFDPNLCYRHNNKDDNDGLFSPNEVAGTNKKCSSRSGWSGNWLNYVTTSRIDALRVVLYGGTRDTDTTSSTVLRRAYIPQDAHSWAKEYTSVSVDGYDLRDYTPLSLPTGSNRHFFGNLTPNAGTNCANLDDCSKIAPWLSYVTNSSKRVWEWASTERPVLAGGHGGTRVNRTVRVQACNATYAANFTPDTCKEYGSGKYKPVGLLHDFGDKDAALFGLITGSYDKNFSGGRLRKVVSSFKDEIDADGRFTSSATIVNTLDSFRLRGFNNGTTDDSYSGGWSQVTQVPSEGTYVDWGNPVGEIMYEAMRYFAGKGSPTTDFAGTDTVDKEVGLKSATWDDPYSNTSKAKAPWCARANLLTISDQNISYDDNQVPGAYGAGASTDLKGKQVKTNVLEDLNAESVLNLLTAGEPDTKGLKFIGQSGAVFDAAPTPKDVLGLGTVKGLAPEEATKRGSYTSAAVAHFAKTHDLNTTVKGNQTVDSFFVALASPLPRIEVPLSTGKAITLVPFAKSVSGFGIDSTKGQFQPTNQIVDFYVESIVNAKKDENTFINGGRYQATFRINFEDIEQGGDHDMDAIVSYQVTLNADDSVTTRLETIYEAGSINHRMGYIASGTQKDGIYLLVQDSSDETPYFLNVPPGKKPGDCDVAPAPFPADCKRLPFLGASGSTSPNTAVSTVTLRPGTASAATFLKDPMWYAAKWGGFVDGNDNTVPDEKAEWDKDGDGIPDSYFFVQNPTKLKQSLRNAFESIIERNSSSSNLSTNSGRLESTSLAYQATFLAGKWSGDVSAYPITAAGFSPTAQWNAAANMPQWDKRRLYLATSGTASVDMRSAAYSSLSTADRLLLRDADTYAYIRGDASKELKNAGGIYRTRDGMLGDIIHSSPNYDPDTELLFVGANDGMLHAFSSKDGVEQFGFIPREGIPRLKNLTSTVYSTAHEYFVDGDVSLAIKTPQTADTKYLFSLLGRGGKGLMSLNVSGTPTASIVPQSLWQYTPLASAAAAIDPDLGLMMSRPVFALLNNGKAALMVGNGYNSTGGKAVLYIFIINTDGSLAEVRKIDTGAGGDNGLAGPAFADTNGDGKADAVYAGDLKGNLWKFDISSPSPASWSVPGGVPLFKAKNALGVEQPITAPVYVALDSVTGSPTLGKYFIFFGTGSYFQSTDASDNSIQSWYGITDGAAIPDRSYLRERTVVETGTVGSREARRFSNAVAGDMSGKRGWYYDLTSPSTVTPGERIIGRSQIISASIPLLMVSSLYPILGDPCTPGGGGFINFVNPFTGGGLEDDLIDVNGDDSFTAADRLSGGAASSLRSSVGIPTTPIFVPLGGKSPDVSALASLGASASETARYFDGNGRGITGKEEDCLGKGLWGLGGDTGRESGSLKCKGGGFRGRVSWREILKD